MQSPSESTSPKPAAATLDEVLRHVEDMARLQFSPEEVAIICGIPSGAMRASEDIATAFLRGRLKAQAEVRQALVSMAVQGSTPAISQFHQLAESTAEASTPGQEG